MTPAFPIGENAHIVAEESDGPRGNSLLTPEERDRYTNRILLCPTHHTTIDKAPGDYPIERLHIMKREHELWVEQQLSDKEARDEVADEIYATLIDTCVEYGDLANWNYWTGWATSSSAKWRADGADRAYALGMKVMGAAWPRRHPELERALETFAHCLNSAAQRFWEESVTEGEFRILVRFYKDARTDEHRADLVDRFNDWVEDCDRLIIMATKAANWLADVVRRDINPRFFAIEGRFTLTLEAGLSYSTQVLEFTDAEKETLPESLFKKTRRAARKRS